MAQITLDQVSAFVRVLQQEQEEAQAAVDVATARLARVKRIEDDLLPNMLREVDMMSFKLSDGRTISVEPNISCSVTEAMWPMAYAWLQENDFDAIVKNQIIVEFDKGQDLAAEAFLKVVTALANDSALFQAVIKEVEATEVEENVDGIASITAKKSIHSQTLKAFVREQMKQGNEVPEDLFSLFITDHVKIK